MAESRPRFSAPFLVKDRLTNGFTRPPLLLCGNGNLDLGQRTSSVLGSLICDRNDVAPQLKNLLMADLYDAPASRFPDGDRRIKITPQCTGREVFIFQTPFPNQDSALMEVFLMADTARRAGAKSITTVLTYYAYGRKDRKDEPRVPISASLVAHLLTAAGTDRVITLDVHADQIQGMILNPWDNLYASRLIVPRVRELIESSNCRVLCTDVGGIARGKAYKKRIPAQGVAFVIKEREINENTSHPDSLLFIGDVEGKDVVIVDDESVSLSSIKNAADEAARHKARNIIAVVSHLKDSEDNDDLPKMWENLNDLPPQFTRLLTTDSIVHQERVRNHRLVEVVDTSSFWAEIIWRTAFGVPLNPDLID